MLRGVHSSTPVTPLYPRGDTAADTERRVLSVARSAAPSSPPPAADSPALYIQIIEALRPSIPQSPSGALAFDYGTFALEGGDLVTVPFSGASVRSPSTPPRVPVHPITALFESRACCWGFKVPGTVIVLGGMSFLIYYTALLAEKDSKMLMTPIILGIVDCMLVWAAFAACLKYIKRNTVVPMPHRS